jgi:hypothetical protein
MRRAAAPRCKLWALGVLAWCGGGNTMRGNRSLSQRFALLRSRL